MSYDSLVLEKGLHDWVVGVTGRTVMFEHPNHPRLTDDTCTMLLTGDTPVGSQDAISYTDEADPDADVVERIESHRVVAVSLNLYRGSVANDMALLKASVRQDQWLQEFFLARLGFISFSDSRDLSAIVREAQWEARLQADFLFNTAYETESVVDTIKSQDIFVTNTGETIQVVPPA